MASIDPVVVRAVRRDLLTWFRKYGRTFPWRKARATLYQRVIAECLLQRTQATTVARFYDDFLSRFPNWRTLAKASPGEIGAVIKRIGLWRRRAVALAKLARVMAERNGRFPGTRNEIESLPGVGQYIANAIMLFSKGKAEPLLDVNMARVVERLFGPRKLVDIRFDLDLQKASRRLVSGRQPIEVNWAILDLAATICKPRTPQCPECPVQHWCQFANTTRKPK